MSQNDSNRVVFEGLEERRMMSGDVPLDPSPPPQLIFPLVINGNYGDDVIKVYQSGLNFVVTKNGLTTYAPVMYTSTISIYGNHGWDRIDCTGLGRKVYIEGGEGYDTITGGSGDDTIYGGAPSLNGPADGYSDSIYGGAGNDLLYAPRWGSQPLTYGGTGNDTIWGSTNNEQIYGETGNDTIYALDGSNYVDGGEDNDYIVTGNGVDTVYGGIGHDNLTTADGGDMVRGGAPANQRNYLGLDGQDMIFAGAGNNQVYGDDNDDWIWTAGDNDTVYGGSGNDHMWLYGGNDSAYGESGNDSIDGGARADWIEGGFGDDTIRGGDGPSLIDSDQDSMWGGDGTDTVSYDSYFADVRITLGGSWENGARADPDGFFGAEYDFVAADFEAALGGGGNDVIVGTAKPEVLNGGGGNDSIRGLAGSDSLIGAAGKDELFGGPGNDTLEGGANDDVLVTVGGGADTAIGGYSNFGEVGDYFWAGTEDTVVADAQVQAAANVHVIPSFVNGASLEPDGFGCPDPVIGDVDCKPDINPLYSFASKFAGKPLFGKGGPVRDDIDQNNLGDCYFLAPLAGIAAAHPEVIRRAVVDLGDGTFAVRFMDGAAKRFIRVDRELPTHMDGPVERLSFAGAANGTLWGPIMEKAWAWFRTGEHSYENIEGSEQPLDPGSSDEAYKALGMWQTVALVDQYSQATIMATMRDWLAAGGIVSASTHLVGSSFTSGHVYTVVAVSWDLKTITLRNPWGTDDATYMQGANDGYMTVSADAFDNNFLFAWFGSV
jgi:Ca2+-binding RTX toxin-like protein